MPALVHAKWSQHSCRIFGSFSSFDAGHSPSSCDGAFSCLVAAHPGLGSQGWCCAALSQGGKLGQRLLPEATEWVCGTIMRKPEEFLNPVKLAPYFFFFFFWQWLFKRVSYHLMICYWLIPMSSSHYAAYRKLQPFGLSRTPGFGGLHIYILVWVWFKQTNSWLNLSINSWMQLKMFGLFSPRVFRLERQWLSASLESVSTRLAFRHVLLFAEVLFSKHSRSDVQELLFLTKTWMSLIAIWYFFFKVVTI